MKKWLSNLSVVATFASSAAWAESPYDGLYVATGVEGWTCEPGEVGMEFGALAIEDGVLKGLENTCQLTNPTQVRGMVATLYDANCTGEGETYSYRLMLMKSDNGVYVIDDGYVAEWTLCEK